MGSASGKYGTAPSERGEVVNTETLETWHVARQTVSDAEQALMTAHNALVVAWNAVLLERAYEAAKRMIR